MGCAQQYVACSGAPADAIATLEGRDGGEDDGGELRISSSIIDTNISDLLPAFRRTCGLDGSHIPDSPARRCLKIRDGLPHIILSKLVRCSTSLHIATVTYLSFTRLRTLRVHLDLVSQVLTGLLAAVRVARTGGRYRLVQVEIEWYTL